MRRVKITGSPPQDWVDEADAVTEQLRKAPNATARATIIEKHEGLWRDERIRGWLLRQFSNKCWYSEAYESVSSVHVDHYRPKGRVKESLGGDTSDGYWWLAFDWSNYRICGQLLNVKKGDLFPVVEGPRCTADGTIALRLESPILIDPIDEDDVGLISYEKDEDACLAVCASDIAEADKTRVTQSIEILGLNRLDRLNTKRAMYWDKCLQSIEEYKTSTGPQPLRKFAQASARKHLKEMITYEAEFSSVVLACIRKNAPESLISAILDPH